MDNINKILERSGKSPKQAKTTKEDLFKKFIESQRSELFSKFIDEMFKTRFFPYESLEDKKISGYKTSY